MKAKKAYTWAKGLSRALNPKLHGLHSFIPLPLAPSSSHCVPNEQYNLRKYKQGASVT